MLFNSWSFLIFFPILIFIYFTFPQRFRWLILLLASYYFCISWHPAGIIYLMISTIISYYTGILIEVANEYKKYCLAFGVLINLGILFVFKYFNFFNDTIRKVFLLFHVNYNFPNLNLLLPIGISFYTFKVLSYIIDVYRGKQKPEKNFGIFALYVSFFPQLVAGPIERSTRLLPQFYQEHKFNYERLIGGLAIMLFGFFKKVVIADNLATVVNQVYNNVYDYQGIHFIIASIFFAFQLYCDFSGYSDISIGCAKILGFDTMENFRTPYYSRSISDFWQRWHISLSSWLKDYVYIPLGGNRVHQVRNYINLFIVFLVSGLWHGANWTFVIWGGLHGSYMVLEKLAGNYLRKMIDLIRLDKMPILLKFFQITYTFSLVTFAWVFFRANNVSEAFYIVSHLHVGVLTSAKVFIYNLVLNHAMINVAKDLINKHDLLIIASTIALLELIQMIQRNRGFVDTLNNRPIWFRWSVYYSLFLCIYWFGKFDIKQFVYGKF